MCNFIVSAKNIENDPILYSFWASLSPATSRRDGGPSSKIASQLRAMALKSENYRKLDSLK